jgi:TctA family transporter
MIDNILLGINVVFSAQGLFYCFLGCIIGTVIGVLPGIGTVTTLSIILPYTFYLSPEFSIIMMAGVYYGAQYGGSNSSILINTPGEPSSAVTCIDGYAMTQKGQGGKAIVAAGISSFIAGLISIVLIALLSPILSNFAFKFGPKEMTLLMLLGLLTIGTLSNKNIITGIGMGAIGILLSTVGTDINSGVIRFSLDTIHLVDGINIAVLAIGVFGISEIFINLLKSDSDSIKLNLKIGFTFDDFKKILPSALRGSGIGSILGLIPGGGSIMASFAAYVVEKKIQKNNKEFGKGAIQGVAAPEAANNAGAQSGFIPLLTLGIPENAVMALILGALILAGIQPGPSTIVEHPALFWGLLVSMVVGNAILLFLNIPMIKFWLLLISTPRRILYPVLFLISLLGVYYINNSMFDIYLALIFGVVGFIFTKLDLEPASLMFGFVIGSMFEEYLRRTLMISEGNFGIFLNSNISIILILIIVSVVVWGIKNFINSPKKES